MLLPDLFQMLAAARACVDDNFAYAFFRLATHYPWQRGNQRPADPAPAPRGHVGHEPAHPFPPQAEAAAKKGVPSFVSSAEREQRPGEWLEGFDDPSICSYPPEDLVIEDYGRYLKKKGMLQLSEEEERTEPFAASMLDGIDMRETIRNLHQGGSMSAKTSG